MKHQKKASKIDINKFEITQELRNTVEASTGELSRDTISRYAKKANIRIICGLIDSEVIEEIYNFYGLVIDYNINTGSFIASMPKRMALC